jgi:hypothetical protein
VSVLFHPCRFTVAEGATTEDGDDAMYLIPERDLSRLDVRDLPPRLLLESQRLFSAGESALITIVRCKMAGGKLLIILCTVVRSSEDAVRGSHSTIK